MSNKNDLVLSVTKSYTIGNREVNMVQMAADDVPREQIAKKLKLSIRTVEFHFDRMRSALGCKTMAALVAVFYRRNLIK